MEARAADSGKNEVDQLIAGNVEIPIIDTRYNGDLTLYKKQLLVEDLRQIGISDGSLRYLLEEDRPTRRPGKRLKSFVPNCSAIRNSSKTISLAAARSEKRWRL